MRFSTSQYRVSRKQDGSAVITVARIGETTGTSSVDYTTQGGTAVADSDYTAASGNLSFAPGETRKTFIVPILEKAANQAVTVELQLANPQGAGLEKPDHAVLTISPDLPVTSALWGFITHPNTLRVLRHLALALLSIAAIHTLGRVIKEQGDRYAKEWRTNLLPPQESLSSVAKPEVVGDPERRIMDAQLARIRQKSLSHLQLMEFFYVRYYMGIITFSVAAALAAITLVLISKKGWQAANEYIITLFFIMTACSVFYQSWPGVFKQQENILENTRLYLKYISLENEVLGYMVTGEVPNPEFKLDQLTRWLIAESTGPQTGQTPATGASTTTSAGGAAAAGAAESAQQNPRKPLLGARLEPREFIHYINLQLGQDSIAIGFDPSKLPNYGSAFTIE